MEVEGNGRTNIKTSNDSDSDDDNFEVRMTQRIFGPQIPLERKPHAPKVSKGQSHHFNTVDNPGRWDEYCFCPKFQAKAPQKYFYHSLPTGTRPVPKQNRNDPKA